jgi:hypothetical protein
MGQTRAVMPSKFVPLADELLEVTGVGDYSLEFRLSKR